MLVRIGDGWYDPEEVVGIFPEELLRAGGNGQAVVLLRGARNGICLGCGMDDAVEDLIAAGLIADPAASTVPKLSPEETEELQHLYALGFNWIARDADGKLYAYGDRPKLDGAYWTAPDPSASHRMQGDFDFVDAPGQQPWAIVDLL